MLLKQPIGRSRLYDLVHRGGVVTCMTITVCGLLGTGLIMLNKVQHTVKRSEVSGENLQSDENVQKL